MRADGPLPGEVFSAGLLRHRLTLPSSDQSCIDAVLSLTGDNVAVATFRRNGPTISVFDAGGTEVARRPVFRPEVSRDQTFSDLALFGTQMALGTETNAATGTLAATVTALDYLGEMVGVRLRLLTNPPASALRSNLRAHCRAHRWAGQRQFPQRVRSAYAAQAPSAPAFVSRLNV